MQVDLKHSYGNLSMKILQTCLFKNPSEIQTPLNQFIRIFHGKNEFESWPQWQSGLKAVFSQHSFDLVCDPNTPECDQIVEVEVWTKESKFEAPVLEDMQLGCCSMMLDQLKVGKGIKDQFNLLKNFQIVGTLVVETCYQREDGPNSVYFDTLHASQISQQEQINTKIVHSTQIDHQLQPTLQRQSQSYSSLPLDPAENIKKSLRRTAESHQNLHDTISETLINPTGKQSKLAEPDVKSFMIQSVYCIQQPVWASTTNLRYQVKSALGSRSGSRDQIRRVHLKKPSIDYFAKTNQNKQFDHYGYPIKKVQQNRYTHQPSPVPLELSVEPQIQIIEDKIEVPTEELPEDFWTELDWQKVLEIYQEDQHLRDQLPETVKSGLTGNGKNSQQTNEQFVDINQNYQRQDYEDFVAADSNKDGRLDLEEYNSIVERAFRRCFERGTLGILYNDQQIQKRFQYMCSLGRSNKGPSMSTFKKLQSMIKLAKKLQELRLQLIDENYDSSWERTWTPEDEVEVQKIFKTYKDLVESLPVDVMQKYSQFKQQLYQNKRLELEYQISEINRFIQADNQKNGYLNIDQFTDFCNSKYTYYSNQFGSFIQKSKQQLSEEFKMLCKLCKNDKGPNFQTICKYQNILKVFYYRELLLKQAVDLNDEQFSLTDWSDDEMMMLSKIYKEDQDQIAKIVPSQLQQFTNKWQQRISNETLDREIQSIQDQLLFIELDKQKTGRLNYNDFKEYLETLTKQTMHNIEECNYKLSEEQACFRYKIANTMGHSESGPSLRALQKWNNIMQCIKKTNSNKTK